MQCFVIRSCDLVNHNYQRRSHSSQQPAVLIMPSERRKPPVMATGLSDRQAAVLSVLAVLFAWFSQGHCQAIRIYPENEPNNYLIDKSTYVTGSSSLRLVCEYWRPGVTGATSEAVWTNLDTGQTYNYIQSEFNPKDQEFPLKKTLPVYAQGRYQCHYPSLATFQVTVHIYFHPLTPSTSPPTSPSTDTPDTPPPVNSVTTTPPGTSTTQSLYNQRHFNGLNPLIYTVLSAVILGVLTIVAIITCFIRSRKAIHRRRLLPRDSPLDYLDFIQENEFTPMTTSEFLASLRERPPTYNESQDIERTKDNEGENGNQQPPPLPQRNPGMIRERSERERRSEERSQQSSQLPQEVTRTAIVSEPTQTSNTVIPETAPGTTNLTNISEGEQSNAQLDNRDASGGGFVDWIEQLNAILSHSPNQLPAAERPREHQLITDTSTHGVLPSLDAIV